MNAPVRSGLVVVDKAPGMTSHGVVARVRRLAGTRKVGHAGTLDPAATGVLLVGLNRATRLLGHLALTEKRYDATVVLGVATTTDDAEGEVLARAATDGLTETRIRDAFATQVGALDQVPSAVSAVKVDGKRAYQRVRDGEDVVLAARRVTVHDLQVTALRTGSEVAEPGTLEVDIAVHCSSGTYIRAIARDVGAALGVGGHLSALRRTAVGPVTLDEARPLPAPDASFSDQGDGALAVLSMETVAARFFPTVQVDEDQARAVGYGQRLTVVLPAPGPVAVLGPDGRFLALYEAEPAGVPGEDPDDRTDASPRARAVAVFV